MPVVVLVACLSAVLLLGRVGPRSASREFPMTWPASAALAEPGGGGRRS